MVSAAPAPLVGGFGWARGLHCGATNRADGGGDGGTIDPPDDGGAVPSVAALDVCPTAAKSICDFMKTCAPEAVTGLWASAAECEPRFRDNCLAAYPPNAKVRKDEADAYTTCLDNPTCDDLYGPRWTVGCTTPRLATTKPAGDPCRSDFECETGACTGSSTTCGTCVKRKKAGEACTSSRECPKSGYCDGDACIAVAFLGDNCDADHVCGNGLGCTSGKCVKIGAVGDTCDSDLDCDVGHLIQCNKSTAKCEKVTFVDPGVTCPPAFDEGSPKVCTSGSNIRCEAFINCRDDKCVLPTFKPCP